MPHTSSLNIEGCIKGAKRISISFVCVMWMLWLSAVQLVSLMILVLLDIFLASFKTLAFYWLVDKKHKLTSSKAIWWIFKKVFIICIPFVIWLMEYWSMWVELYGIDLSSFFHRFWWIIIWWLIAAEGYSILWHLIWLWTLKEVQEFDAILFVLNSIRNGIRDWMIFASKIIKQSVIAKFKKK
jgi:hypothetical protein